jgi:hypothetical protein
MFISTAFYCALEYVVRKSKCWSGMAFGDDNLLCEYTNNMKCKKFFYKQLRGSLFIFLIIFIEFMPYALSSWNID